MKRRVALLASLVVAFASVAFAQNDMQILAVVKANRTETITLKQLKDRVEFVQKQNGLKLTSEQRSEILDNLINEKLLVQAATKEGLVVTDSQVTSAFLNQFSQSMGRQLTESELDEVIRTNLGMSISDYLVQSAGMTLAEYKAYLKNQILIQQYVVSKYQNELAAVSATDLEIRSAYDMNRKNFMWNDMMRLFFVSVPKASDKASANAMANQLRDRISKDRSAENAILNESKANDKYTSAVMLLEKTSTQATALGWSYDKLIELFDKDLNYVSDVTETTTDFQFYVVTKKYGAKLLDIGDCMVPDTTTTVYDYIRQNLTAEKQMQFMSSTAASLAESLNTAENVERKKTGDDLLKLLNW